MLLCLPAYFVIILLKPFMKRKKYHHFVSAVARVWAQIVILSTGSKITVSGSENLDAGSSFCFVSNHQGMLDIPLIMGFIHQPVGFIAKQELFKIPVLSYWMRELNCIFIDRKSARHAIACFEHGAKVIKSGYSIVIFPEGTRSKGKPMADFHSGSFKLPQMADAKIIPLCIDGTYRIFEQNKLITPSKVRLQILPAISPDEYRNWDKQQLARAVHDKIQQCLSSGAGI